MGAAAGAAVAAIGWSSAVVVGVVLRPVLAAAAGPVGYDMAQSWVPEEERPPVAARGSRAAVHVAGVAIRRFTGGGPLLVVSSVVGVCAALALWLVVIFAVAGMVGDD